MLESSQAVRVCAYHTGGGGRFQALRLSPPMMQATRWEFENRALIIGVLFAVAFALSAVDRSNTAVAVAQFVAARAAGDANRLTRAIFAGGAAVCALAALTRTWASAYLSSDVVYAGDVKTASL